MEFTGINLRKIRSLSKIAAVCCLIFIIGADAFGQYKGAPVKKDRLLKALRSKQLQTSDIVAVIRSNGVDFPLTTETREALIAAGARPEVINAVANNRRVPLNKNATTAKNSKRDYDELLNQAMFSYKEKRNPNTAINFLKTAVKLKPNDSKAYQMLGFINLYGLHNLTEAQKYMRESIENGGSAVFRVYHDDNGNFTHRCSGSLFVSPEIIRYEADDNTHTFETAIVNVDKIKLDRESSKLWNKHTIFKVFLKIGDAKTKFRFAPVTGNVQESQMVAQFVKESKTEGGFAGLAINLSGR